MSLKLEVDLVRLETLGKEWNTRRGKLEWLHHIDSTLKGLGVGWLGLSKVNRRGE